MKKTIIMVCIISGLVVTSVAQARDTLSLAGSSTVLPFARIIAEQLGKNPNFKTPVVESGGSSVGKKGVCDGVGTKFIDIGNASSRMKTKELAYCEKNGVKLTEIKVGYDGIVVANSKKGIPSAPPKKFSMHLSGWGIIPKMFCFSLTIPAMFKLEPLGLPLLFILQLSSQY